VSAKFVVNNKAYLVTKVFLFKANYDRELRIEVNIRKNGKMEKATEFAEKIKKIQEKVGVILRKTQEKIKQQADRRRKEVEK